MADFKNTVKTHTFNGTVYDLHIEAVDGLCDSPKPGGKPNFIVPVHDQDSRKFLESVIHEALHACNWKASEESVTQTAYDVARLLWRLGFRKRATSSSHNKEED